MTVAPLAPAPSPRPRATPETARDAPHDPLTEFLVRHRWATVVPLVLPLSKAYDAWWTLEHVLLRELLGQPGRHGQRVESVRRQIGAWNAAGRPGRLCTSRRAWQSVAVRAGDHKRRGHPIDLDLHDILEVDVPGRRIRVEPRVNMAQITRRLVPMGFTLPVVPELDDLTAGGLLLGYGIESSSHRFGLFADTVRAVEVVLADGRVVWASREAHPDLFHALPWSYGCHGLVTAMDIDIVPTEPFVRITYEPVEGLDAIVARFTELACADDPPEHVEGLLYSRDTAVIMHGDACALGPGERPHEIGRFWEPWFYEHARSFLHRGPATEVLPLRQWYHRHTRSLYWHGELLVPFGNHPLFRHTLGWLMPPKVQFLKLTQTERFRRYRDARNVVQDALVPIRRLRETIERFHEWFECYPLWLCPHLTFRTEPQGMIGPSPACEGDREMYVDVGAWQVPGMVKRGEPWDGREAVRAMEAWLRDHDGYQCLYAVTEQTREELWQMFDRTLHDRVRADYGGEGAFMDVFDKVGRSG